MSDSTKIWFCIFGYLAGMWISGGWLYAEDAKCRADAREIEERDKARGIYTSIEGRDCGYGSMHLMPGTVGWPVYWFIRSSHEAFQ